MDKDMKLWHVTVELKETQKLPDNGGYWYTDLVTGKKVIVETKEVDYFLQSINETTKVISAKEYSSKKITQVV
jgi:hypothetical protein